MTETDPANRRKSKLRSEIQVGACLLSPDSAERCGWDKRASNCRRHGRYSVVCVHYWLLHHDYEDVTFIRAFKSLEKCQEEGTTLLASTYTGPCDLSILEIIDGHPSRCWRALPGEAKIDEQATEEARKKWLDSLGPDTLIQSIGPTIYSEWITKPSWGKAESFSDHDSRL